MTQKDPDLCPRPLLSVEKPATAISIVTAFIIAMLYILNAENAPQNLKIKQLEDNQREMRQKYDSILATLSSMNSALQVLASKNESNKE